MSVETVTVKAVGQGNPWKHGITYYDIEFERNGEPFEASWGKKGDAPQVGEEVEGEFTQRDGEWKFKKGSADFNGSPSSGSSDYIASSEYRSGGQDPIGVQWALGRAIELQIAGTIQSGERTTVAKTLLAERDAIVRGDSIPSKEAVAEAVKETFPGTEEIDKEDEESIF